MNKVLSFLAVSLLIIICSSNKNNDVKPSEDHSTTLNNRLKGSWLYPFDEEIEYDLNGQEKDRQLYSHSAIAIDGATKLSFTLPTKNVDYTYKLQNKDGIDSLFIQYNPANATGYKIELLDDNNLTLSTVTNIKTNGAVVGTRKSLIHFKRGTAADANNKTIKVIASQTLPFNISIYTKKGTAETLVHERSNITAPFEHDFIPTTGNQLKVKVTAQELSFKIKFFTYYEGKAFLGDFGGSSELMETGNGFDFPEQ